MRRRSRLMLHAETVRVLAVAELVAVAGGEPKSGNATVCPSSNCTSPTTDTQTGSAATCRANSNCGCGQD